MIFATKIAFFPKTPIIFSGKTDNFRAINIFYAKCTGVCYSFRLSLQILSDERMFEVFYIARKTIFFKKVFAVCNKYVIFAAIISRVHTYIRCTCAYERLKVAMQKTYY